MGSLGIEKQIQILGEKIDYISQNTQFTITIIVAVIGVSIAIAGVALYKLSRAWVNKAVQDELEVIKKELKEESQKFILNNQSYLIRAWDSAPTTTYKINGEYISCIPVYIGNEQVIQPPIISVYIKNKHGERRSITDYFTVNSVDDRPNENDENRIYICIKEKRLDGEQYEFIAMWEKAKNNEKARLTN